ncbi:MAG TPA: stage II sporulation protein M [Gemmatimonadales bacterium]|nr:stage II sporulation protein M [Gemmatimonadales bacterium]
MPMRPLSGAPAPRAPASPDFRQHLEVETPEHVVLDFEIAGIGSRALAAIVDFLILIAVLLAATVSLSLWPSEGSRWTTALFTLAAFALYWGYYVFFEGVWRGQTPGKRLLGIRVIRDTGHAVRLSDAAARNLLRVADMLPPPYLLGALFVAIHPRGKRLGDLVAGTVVVRDQPVITAREQGPAPADSETAGEPELSDDEYRVLREFAGRAAALPAGTRDRLASDIAMRFAARYPHRPEGNVAFLASLYQEERARRRGRFGARAGRLPGPGGPGGGGGGGAGSVAERLVARKSGRWREFQVLAERAGRRGLDDLSAAELPDFARRYREVAADLARARTYGADPVALIGLERLVAAGHTALYRDERRTWGRIVEVITRECPAAVVEARRYVLLAFTVFMLPALGGYFLLRQRPELAPEILPDVILERAEAGAARAERGERYVEVSSEDRPVMASAIIGNNISVAFNCFAGGIFLGVGSLVFLAYNGLAIGATSGHFANAGLAGYLWTFVLGHGVLELFAIWVAGAAGFLLGRAIVAPGEYTRRDALVLSGRRAIRMIGVVILLLLIAGTIEGLISAGDWPLSARLIVSGGSLIFLVLYLANGARSGRCSAAA